MKLLLLLLMIIPIGAQANYEKKDVEQLLDALITGLSKRQNLSKIHKLKDFSVKGCQRPKINPQDLILMKESARTIHLKFSKDCDLEGEIKPLIFVGFPIMLKIKDFDEFHTVKSQNKITASFDSKPILTLTTTDGEFISKKGSLKFILNYQVRINPTTTKNQIEENLGGTITVTEAFNKKINVSRKFYIK